MKDLNSFLEVVSTFDEFTLIFYPEAHHLNLGIQCKHFRDQDILTDVTLVIGNQEFRSHRLVLATNIPYFNKMFCSGMIEANKGRVKIAKSLRVVRTQTILFLNLMSERGGSDIEEF